MFLTGTIDISRNAGNSGIATRGLDCALHQGPQAQPDQQTVNWTIEKFSHLLNINKLSAV